MTRTTIYLNEAAYLELKRLARGQRLAPAALIRTAVEEYLARHARHRLRPTSIGCGDSGLPDLGQRDEEYMPGMGDE